MDELADAAKKAKSSHSNGLIGISGTGMWSMAPYFLSLGGKYCDDNYTKATGYVNSVMPTNTKSSVSVVGGEDIVMFQSCKNQIAAWEFMKFMFSEDTQKTMALKVNQYPVNKKVVSDPELASDKNFQLYMKQLDTAWARIPNPAIEEMDSDIGLAFESSFRHKGTVQENLDKLAKQLDELFAKNN